MVVYELRGCSIFSVSWSRSFIVDRENRILRLLCTYLQKFCFLRHASSPASPSARDCLHLKKILERTIQENHPINTSNKLIIIKQQDPARNERRELKQTIGHHDVPLSIQIESKKCRLQIQNNARDRIIIFKSISSERNHQHPCQRHAPIQRGFGQSYS